MNGEASMNIISSLYKLKHETSNLREKGLLNAEKGGWQRFFVSGEAGNFEVIGGRLLGYKIKAYSVRL